MTCFALRVTRFFCALSLALLCAGGAPAFAGGSDVVIHLIVISGEASPGLSRDQAMNDLKKGFIEMGGGYTDMGAASGGTEVKDGQAEKSPNTTFIVSAPQDMSEEFTALGKRLFNGDKPFILTWKGSGNF